MRGWLAALASLAMLAACAQAESAPQKPAQTAQAEPVPAPPANPPMAVPPPSPPEQAPPAPPPTIQAPNNLPPSTGSVKLDCSKEATQGGAVLCRTAPKARLSLDGKAIAVADDDGLAVIGLTRAQKTPAKIGFAVQPGMSQDRMQKTALVDVLKRKDTVTSFEMECNKIAPQSEEEKKKASDSWIKKDAALKTFAPPLAPVKLESPVSLEGVAFSSSFGATRTYIPKTKDCEPTTNVHNGSDIAVPKGTEIHAPMAGTVILADPDLYFEGGCVFLDIGRGMVSVTMHMSRIDVKAGQVVKQGELLGLSGATGRVTGPHLHWAIKYRNVNDKERDSDIWLDPMLLLKLDSTKLADAQ